MATSIERYKYYEQVKNNNLDRLANARNDYLAFKEEAKSMVVGLKRRLQLSEEERSSLAKKATKQEACIENLVARLRDSEAKITWARNDLETEMNQHIRAESDLKMAVKNTRKKMMEEAL